MRVLVTGSEGFIGRHLCAELETAGHVVVGADIEPAKDERDLFRADLTFPGVAHDALSYATKAIGELDYCVHLAAQVGRLFGERDVGHTIRSNAEMTAYVAQACGARGVKLAYASTSEVYGDQGDKVCAENQALSRLPHNLYGLSKRWGEEVCQLYANGGLVAMRFSMPYGTGVPPGRGRAAINNVLWQAATRQEIPIHIGAERSWCWVGDTVLGVRMILESGAWGPFNVGRDDDAVSMLKIADMACEMTGADRSLIKTIPAPSNQTVVKRLSTKRLQSLGWRPHINLEDGMRYVLNWVQQYDDQGELKEAA